MLYQLSSGITHPLRINSASGYYCLFVKDPLVDLHYVRFILLSMLNKEMVNFSHGVNVVCDGSILWVIMDGKNREK